MKVHITTGGILGDYLPPGSRPNAAEMEVAEGTTPGDVIRQLGMPSEDDYLVSLNGTVVNKREWGRVTLSPQDTLSIMPALRGG